MKCILEKLGAMGFFDQLSNYRSFKKDFVPWN
jgi:hypothetical protein